MKKHVHLSAITFMAIHSFANAQSDSTLTTKSADAATTANRQGTAVDKISYKQDYLVFTPEYNFSKLIDGLALGLQSTNGGGQPGSSADMAIRGLSSISGNNDPLILIDGMPYYGDYAAINKNDIASITVLNDAASTFEFANRGVNGIIAITTKSKITGAKSDHKEKLEVNAQFGVSTPELPAYKTLDTKQYFETLNSALKNVGINENVVDFAGGYNPYNVPKEQLIGSDGKLNPNAQLQYHDNWRHEMTRPGMRQDYNVATSDNGKTGAYYLSAGYLSDKGYVQQTGYERFSARFNGHLNITKWLELGVRSQAAIADQHYATWPAFRAEALIAPVYPVYYRNANGEKEADPQTGMNKFDWGNVMLFPNSSIGNSRYVAGANSIGSLYLDNNLNKINTFIINPYLSASFLKHFSYTADFNYGLNKINTTNDYNDLYGQFAATDGATTKAYNNLTQINFRHKLEWDQQWSDHHLHWTLGNDYFKQSNDYYSESNTGHGTGTPSTSSFYDQYRMLSYYTMATYDYKDKYVVSGGVRRDGESFADGQWQTNWYGGVAYKISHENFMKALSWMDALTLKLNYGTQGNAILYRYNEAAIASPSKQISGVIEGSLFNRLSFKVQAYSRATVSNYPVPQPPTTNLPPVYEQMKIGNKGINFELTATVIKSRNFSWDASFQWNHNTNRITMMPVSMDTLISNIYKYKKGNSIGDFYMPEYAGVDKTNGNALYYINDANGNKTTTSNYATAVLYGGKDAGSAFPKMFGSYVNTFTLKQLEFSFQVNYSIGGKYYDDTYAALMGDGSGGTNWSADILNAWTPTNTNTNVPVVSMYNVNTPQPSTRFLKDASYLSFANAYLGYVFNYDQVKKLKMQSLRVYISANNLYMIAGRKGMNPQADFYNYPGYVYAPARTIVFGLKVGI